MQFKKTISKKNVKTSKKKVKPKVVSYVPNLRKHYLDNVTPELIKRFNYINPLEVPKLATISINMGVGDAKVNPKALESAVEELTLISGQKPIITLSRKDISNFKIRRGFPVGCKVTIRGYRMYEFLDRLINLALPRVRDFRGLNPKSFDGNGNFSMGIKEQIIFHEIDYDKVDKVKGLDIIICTSAKTDEEALELLKSFNMPFPDKNN